jgi:hypothetical protein
LFPLRARARALALAAVGVVALGVASPAAAHSRSPAIALDYRVRLAPETEALRGVRVELVDGGRWLRVRVEPPAVLEVEGSLGEAFLRFAPNGVWVNASSPTAEAVRLVSRGSGWRRLTDRHELTWHDHRLAPPPLTTAGFVGRFSLPATLDGRPTAIAGTFWSVRKPLLAFWIGAGALAVAALALAGRLLRSSRASLAAWVATVGAAAALAMETAFAVANPLAHERWLQVAAAVVLLAAVVATLAVRSANARRWIALTVGVYASLMGLSAVSTLLHGVVISTLPAPAVRAATLIALVCGCAAVLLAVVADADRPVTRRAR